MDTVNQEVSYRKILRRRLNEKKNIDKTCTAAFLSKEIGVKNSYLSAVFKGRAELSADQLFDAAHVLGLDDDELERVSLIHQIERCSSQVRRQRLQYQLEKLTGQASGNTPDIKEEPEGMALGDSKIIYFEEPETALYFSNPYFGIVHMYLCVEEFKKSPELLINKLKIGEAFFYRILKTLTKLQLIAVTDRGVSVLKSNVQLTPNSMMAKAHRCGIRLKAVEALQREVTPSDYFFSATMAGDEQVRKKIKEKFQQFLGEVAGLLKDSKGTEVIQLNLDLFSL